jgi:hypothetical protein
MSQGKRIAFQKKFLEGSNVGVKDLPSDLDSFFNDVDDDLARDWGEVPVDFRTLVESYDHMGLPPLTERQYQAAEALLGKDPTKTFTDPALANMGVFVVGKGGGKDTVGTLMACAVVHVLLCNKNPQRLCRQLPHEKLDFVNVASNQQQAQDVYFEKLKSLVLSWRWLKNRYVIMESDRVISRPQNPPPGFDRFKDVVKITADKIVFPHGIRIVSRHSMNERWEGLNIVFWVMDEASAFRSENEQENADRIYSTLRTSASSRFPHWKGIVMSFPRQEKDFTLTLYESVEGNKRVYRDFAYPWEWKPFTKGNETICYSGEVFIFDHKGISLEIPIEYFDDFNSPMGISDAVCKYLCDPPKAEDPYFEYPDRLDGCIVPDRRALLEVKSTFVSYPDSSGKVIKYIGKEITLIRSEMINPKTSYFIHADGGEIQCNAAMTLAHIEEVDGIENAVRIRRAKLIVDVTIIWEPDRRTGLQVSLLNLEDIIVQLAKILPVRYVAFDHWNSATGVERLVKLGIKAERHNVSCQDYDFLKSLVYTGLIESYDARPVIDELKYLRNPSGKEKPRKRSGMKQDASDTWAGVARLIGDLKTKERFLSQVPKGRAMGQEIFAMDMNRSAAQETFGNMRRALSSSGQMRQSPGVTFDEFAAGSGFSFPFVPSNPVGSGGGKSGGSGRGKFPKSIRMGG